MSKKLIKIVKKLRNKNSELFARNPILLARPQTLVLHQILRHVSGSEFLAKPEFSMLFLMISKKNKLFIDSIINFF
ncbi:MAG: hypothetical protein AB1Z29_17580 [Desulfobacterales bacterium]|jgi:hypothetical protein